MLKRNMATHDEETQDGEDAAEPKPDHLSFEKLSSGVSRRTASSVFFELLQLKVSILSVLEMMIVLDSRDWLTRDVLFRRRGILSSSTRTRAMKTLRYVARHDCMLCSACFSIEC